MMLSSEGGTGWQIGRRRAWARSSAVPGTLGVLLALAAAAYWLGCGGGSPSDVVIPQDVEVTLAPVEVPGPRSVTLALKAASGREIALDLIGLDMENATGVAFDLEYDPNFLEFVGADPGEFFGPGAVAGAGNLEDGPGRLVGVAAVFDQAVGRSGSGALLTFRFRLRELRDGITNLIFEVPQSVVYGPDSSVSQHVFTGARLVTRIRLPE
jgi:hypothetical protein